MDVFLDMSPRDRHLACLQAEEQLNLQAASIEKDLWVCWTLREAAALQGLGGHLTFKGGTSLSKGWKLIERFSEDIDLVVDRQTLGFGGEASPEHASSKRGRKRLLKELVAASGRPTSTRYSRESPSTERRSSTGPGWTTRRFALVRCGSCQWKRTRHASDDNKRDEHPCA